MADTDKDRMTRAYTAFLKQGDNELEAMNKATAYVRFYKKQKRRGLFDDTNNTTSATASTRG